MKDKYICNKCHAEFNECHLACPQCKKVATLEKVRLKNDEENYKRYLDNIIDPRD